MRSGVVGWKGAACICACSCVRCDNIMATFKCHCLAVLI